MKGARFMTLMELSCTLRDMYDNAPDRDHVAMIHLFGIKYANEIKKADFSTKEILKNADMPLSYQTEINKGIRLARYVIPK